MKFYRCYYLEPTNKMAHGADKIVNGKEISFVPSKEVECYICLDSGMLFEKDFDGITIRHISVPYASYTEIKFFDCDMKSFTLEEISGKEKIIKKRSKLV